MRTLLMVGMTSSVHMARFCDAIDRREWRIYFFPCHDVSPHAALKDVIVFDPAGAAFERPGTDAARIERVLPRSPLAAHERIRALSLARVIRRLKPDLIHAQELQHGGYLVSAAAKLLRSVPPIVTTTWGSDLSLRARVPEHLPRIRDVLDRTAVLVCECERDYRQARDLGFAGYTAPPMPVAGSISLDETDRMMAPGPTSARRTIAVKGYHGWAGRSQVALRALERCTDLLGHYEVVFYSTHPETAELARRFAAVHGVEVSILSTLHFVPHEDVLALHGRSRISIGLSVADGISTSLLEAMAMGSLPIQSSTACATEWITDGRTGFVVPPEDPAAVARAIERALTDDQLVDDAAITNRETIGGRLTDAWFREQLRMVYDRATRT